MTGIGQLETHHHHQAEPNEQEDESTDAILEADNLVIGGKDIFAPPSQFVMVVPGIVAVR